VFLAFFRGKNLSKSKTSWDSNADGADGRPAAFYAAHFEQPQLEMLPGGEFSRGA
jgi:hypothetical protein